METNLLEAELRIIYDDLKKQLPGLHRLTFELGEYKHLTDLSINGFYHIDSDCKSYEDLSDLKSKLKNEILYKHHNQILYRKF